MGYHLVCTFAILIDRDWSDETITIWMPSFLRLEERNAVAEGLEYQAKEGTERHFTNSFEATYEASSKSTVVLGSGFTRK